MKDKKILYVGYGIVAVLFYMAYKKNEQLKNNFKAQLQK